MELDGSGTELVSNKKIGRKNKKSLFLTVEADCVVLTSSHDFEILLKDNITSILIKYKQQ